MSAPMVRRFPYVVYYRIQGGRVSILAIQHGARDPSAWQSRLESNEEMR